MAIDVTVIHIDDEFTDLVNLWPRRFSRLAYAYHKERADPAVVSDPKVKSLNGAGRADIVAREFTSPALPKQMYTYIFVGEATVPASLASYITPCTLFVIDVLRTRTSECKSGMSARESIESIKQLGVRESQMVLFTALQGSDLLEIQKEYCDIELISKLRSQSLDLRLLKLVQMSTRDD